MKLTTKIRTKAEMEGENPSDAAIQARVEEEIELFKNRMPFKVSIARDAEDKEKLTIASISDRDGREVADSSIEIHIQSLGVDEEYWLDSGAFDF